MADAIMNHQTDAFAKDPYAAGTALYPEVGPALPEEDVNGRLTQARMIGVRRGMPVEAIPVKANVSPADMRDAGHFSAIDALCFGT